MMKGYLTVFLALSLSVLTGFVLLLTGGAIRNAEKVRAESAADVAANAVLSEYHRGLLEEYDLLYIDTSYLSKEPSYQNLEDRLLYYINENLDMSWGNVIVTELTVKTAETAAADMGASMRNQAVIYIKDRGKDIEGQWQILELMEEIRNLDAEDPLTEWDALMEELEKAELPQIQNDEGKWETIPLSNPTDGIYALTGSDILYLAEADMRMAGVASITLQDYISHRNAGPMQGMQREYLDEENAFLTYLFEKLGCVPTPSDSALLHYQLEYVAMGMESDIENAKAMAKKLFGWRFADNLSCALTDGALYEQASKAAEELPAVQLKPELKEPVIRSILYACAFMESIGDLRTLYQGGKVPLKKNIHNMSVDHVLNGTLYNCDFGEGISYCEYLAGAMLLLDKSTVNLRIMDIIETEMRIRDGNPAFAMDWCVERYEMRIVLKSSYGDSWVIDRKYGFF